MNAVLKGKKITDFFFLILIYYKLDIISKTKADQWRFSGIKTVT